MKCLSPVLVKTSDYRIFVPCNKCVECRSTQTKDWKFRLEQELKDHKTGCFVTLTYSDQHVPQHLDKNTGELINVLDKADFQKWMKKVRKIFKEKLKYFAVGEYGSRTYRPHYHAILFGVSPGDASKLSEKWEKGFIHIGQINQKTIGYTLKYVNKSVFAYQKGRKKMPVEEFRLISKKLGYRFMESGAARYQKMIGDDIYRKDNHKRQRMPKYYRDKTFSIRDKEKLSEKWIDTTKAAYDWKLLSGKKPAEIEKEEREKRQDRIRRYHKLINQKDKL